MLARKAHSQYKQTTTYNIVVFCGFRNSILLDDNLSVHKARSMKAWFAKARIEGLTWNAQVPDLNPTKHLLDKLLRPNVHQSFLSNMIV